jgi:structure-specific recognition protein 1
VLPLQESFMVMSESSTLSFDSIMNRNLANTVSGCAARDFSASGKFKMAASGFGWKSSSSGNIITVPLDSIQKFEWLRAFSGYQLRIITKDENLLRFDGFSQDSRADLAKYVQNVYNIPFEDVDVSLKGWNWGRVEAVEGGKQLEFRVEDQLAFDLPIDSVVNAAVTSKGELTLEIITEDIKDSLDCISQIRFFLPRPTVQKTMEEQQEELRNISENPAELEREESESEDEAEKLCDLIRSVSTAAAAPGSTLVTITELQCLVPRGKYDADFGKDFVRLHGKTYDYKILFSSIHRLFLLPKADENNVLLVIALDPPLRQGQTRYPFLLIQFSKEDFIELDVEESADSAETKLEKRYEGPLFEVTSNIVRHLTGQKLTVPGGFRSAKGLPCVKGAYRANEGHLYMLEKSLLFLPKPIVLINHNEISKVMFGRTGPGLGNPRSFDLKIMLKASNLQVGNELMLSNVPKEDLEVVEEYFISKGISLVKEGEQKRAYKEKIDEEESSEEESNHGDKKRKKKRVESSEEEEEDESPDEDYVEGDDDEDESEEEEESDYDSEEDEEEDEPEEEDD